MKKLIVASLLIVGLSAFTQNGKEMGNRPDRDGMEKMSSEQRNQLLVKKMTLELDLNAKQQEQVKQIIAEQSAKRETLRAEQMEKKQDNVRPTADEQFAMQSKMLDKKIALQNEMKTILTQDQFKVWKEMSEKFQEKHYKRNHEKREAREEKEDH